jgi:hypothetical protein
LPEEGRESHSFRSVTIVSLPYGQVPLKRLRRKFLFLVTFTTVSGEKKMADDVTNLVLRTAPAESLHFGSRADSSVGFVTNRTEPRISCLGVTNRGPFGFFKKKEKRGSPKTLSSFYWDLKLSYEHLVTA